MKSSVETLEGNKVRLTVEVPESEFDQEVTKAFQKIGSEVKLPGFRKGKAPRKVLEARIGKDAARAQALEDAIPEFFIEILKQSEIDMVSRPQYEIKSGQTSGPLTFEVLLETRPEIELTEYKDLKVEINNIEPTEEDIQKGLAQLADQYAELEEVERESAEGDTVVMDITTTHAGVEIEGLTANDYSYVVGSAFPIAKVNRELVGVKAGEVLEFDSEHPGNPEEKLDFHITVKTVKEIVTPELTDEMVKSGTELETVAEYREKVEKDVRYQLHKQASESWRELVGEKLAEQVEIDLPEMLVEDEVMQRFESAMSRLKSNGVEPAKYFEMTGQEPKDFIEQLKGPAEASVKLDLALRALAKAESIELSDTELDKEIEDMAKGAKMTVEDLRSRFDTPHQMMLVRADIVKRRAAEWLFENSELVDPDGNVIDKDALDKELERLFEERSAAMAAEYAERHSSEEE